MTTTGCTTGVPGTPGNAQVSGVTGTSISLSWTASTGTVTGYRVYEGTTLKATVTATSATISGLTACSSHTYAVRAYNGTGESGSATATGTTSGCTTGHAAQARADRLLAGLRQRRHPAEAARRCRRRTTSSRSPSPTPTRTTPAASRSPSTPACPRALGGYTDAQLQGRHRHRCTPAARR